MRFRVVAGDGLGDALQEHGFTGFRRCHDQAALAFADRRYQVDHPGGDVLGGAVADLHDHPLGGEQRGQVLEQDFGFGVFRPVGIDLADLEHGEVAFAILGGPDLAGDGVAGTQVEATYLAGRHVNVIRAGQVRAFRGAQEAEAVLQNFQHPITVNIRAVFRGSLEDGEDNVLFAGSRQVLQAEFLGNIQKFADRLLFQFGKIHWCFTGCPEMN